MACSGEVQHCVQNHSLFSACCGAACVVQLEGFVVLSGVCGLEGGLYEFSLKKKMSI